MEQPTEVESVKKGAKPKVPPRPPNLKMGSLSPLLLTPARQYPPSPVSPRPPSLESENRKSSSSPPVSRLKQRFGRLFSMGGSTSQPPSPTSSDKWSPCSSDGFEELNSPRSSRKNKRFALPSVSSEPSKPQSPSLGRRLNNWRSKSDSAKVVKAMRHGVISPTTPTIRVFSLADTAAERGMIAAKKMVPTSMRPPTTPAKMFAPIRGERGSWHRIFRLPQLLLSTVC